MHSIDTFKQHVGDRGCPEHGLRPAISEFNTYTSLLFCCNTFRDSVRTEPDRSAGRGILEKKREVLLSY